MDQTLLEANRLRVQLSHLLQQRAHPSDVLHLALQCAGIYNDLGLYVDANHVLCSAVDKRLSREERNTLRNAIKTTIERYEQQLMFSHDTSLTLKHLYSNREYSEDIMREGEDDQPPRD